MPESGSIRLRRWHVPSEPDRPRPRLRLPRWNLLLPVAAAACYAGMQVLTRKLGGQSAASAMAIYIQGTFIVVSAGFFLVAGSGRFASDDQSEALEFLLRAWVPPPLVRSLHS